MKKIIYLLLFLSTGICNAQKADIDPLLTDFLNADKNRAQKRLSSKIIKSKLSFDEVYKALKIGKKYSRDAKKGFILWKYLIDSLEHIATVFVPNSYNPKKRYSVHFNLHGAVSNYDMYSNHNRLERNGYNCDSIEAIYIYPAGWKLRPWWHEGQHKNIQYLLSRLKATYNIDENNIHFSGVSDGATGLFYQVNLNKTYWATLIPYIGNLGSAVLLGEIPVYVRNYKNSKFLIYNTDKDHIFTLDNVMLYINLLKKQGINVNHHIIKGFGHTLEWYPQQKDSVGQFIKQNPRNPFPEKICWQTDKPKKYGRCFWVNIEKIYALQKTPLDGYVGVIGKYSTTKKVEPRPSGRVDIESKGNRIDITTKKVKKLSLLLSPDQFDFKKPFEVYTNGKLYFIGDLQPDLKTLLKWYLIDKDRTMLYAYEMEVEGK